MDSSGDLFVADTTNNVVYEVIHGNGHAPSSRAMAPPATAATAAKPPTPS